ncbi:putative m protein repeat protein [Erysiphe necator]|uniref:Putative m protein repeat protein n=1 Tax=Uncinula necator TaxID=52586 RepID=A0A0B1P1W4_UNCNE|nr:putative m protein repeat protein [Erysiphe necator]
MDDQAKAQKLAAAKRRVEQLKKKKGNVKKEIDPLEASVKSSAQNLPDSFETLLTNETTTTEEAKNYEEDKINEVTSTKDIEQHAITSIELKSNSPSSQNQSTLELMSPVNHKISTSDLALDEEKHRDDFEWEDKMDKKRILDSKEINPPKLAESSDSFETEGIDVTNLQIEYRSQLVALDNQKAEAEKKCHQLCARIVELEAENQNLRQELNRLSSCNDQNMVDKGLDQISQESSARFLVKIKELEDEISELRRGFHSSPKSILNHEDSPGTSSLGVKFIDVDLGAYSSQRRDSSFTGKTGLGKLISNSLNAITGTNNGYNEYRAPDEDELIDFDEDAFRLAKEEESKNRIERIKNIKRNLKEWEGWRLNLVDVRNKYRDSSGASPIFEI